MDNLNPNMMQNPDPKSSKGLIIAVVIIILVIAGIAWYVLGAKKNTLPTNAPVATENTDNSPSVDETVNTNTPQEVPVDSEYTKD